VNSLFCRHNRFTADCPICSKDTLLDSTRAAATPARRLAAPGRARRSPAAASGGRFMGPYAGVGPYEDEAGTRYEVRLERVPGGLRLAEWGGGAIRRRAPSLPAADVVALIEAAGERNVLGGRDLELLSAALAGPVGSAEAEFGASRGRAGDLQEELRVERRAGEERVRVGRWTLRPGAGWSLHEAPTMMPAKRYAEALEAAVRAGVVAPTTGGSAAA